MKNIDSFESITFEYNTGSIPPPFCHWYKIVLTKSDSQVLQIDLKLEYHDRDEISEEEIFDEGFSLDDDFVWHGHLPEVWEKEITKKLKSTKWRKKQSPRSDGSAFSIKILNQNQTKKIHPDDCSSWENFCQEIMQAAFELSNKEAPLFISFVNRLSSKPENQVDFQYIFSLRVVKVLCRGKSHRIIEWKEGQQLLKYIFGLDYLPEDGMEKIPKIPGNFISPGDGLWYQLIPKENLGAGMNEKISKLVNTLNAYIT